jgi:colicin import membrane protein
MTDNAEQAAAGAAEVDAEAAAAAAAPAKAKKEKEAKPPRPSLEEAYGVTRPADPLSKTGQVWAMADKLSRAAGRPIERKAVVDALKETINLATIATQYGKWRHFNGLKGVKIEVPVDPAVVAAKEAAKAAKKEAEAKVKADAAKAKAEAAATAAAAAKATAEQNTASGATAAAA